MRSRYKALPETPLYCPQTVFNHWVEADTDEEVESVYDYLQRHQAFDNPEYVHLVELFDDDFIGPYNEQGFQRHIDAYLNPPPLRGW
ncbi:hypothetical protein [Ectobacillus ponti]|uniref:Uncharacterized protein n=1 Tax=Ectobacillus ponti TaxID=2961894 RepID=A0AA41XCY5_9BACI|nr:hypothetical protein [Ectobacillus ponti]MCP8970583.1 hypothetical protein [Ectobacillus ponti]